MACSNYVTRTHCPGCCAECESKVPKKADPCFCPLHHESFAMVGQELCKDCVALEEMSNKLIAKAVANSSAKAPRTDKSRSPRNLGAPVVDTDSSDSEESEAPASTPSTSSTRSTSGKRLSYFEKVPAGFVLPPRTAPAAPILTPPPAAASDVWTYAVLTPSPSPSPEIRSKLDWSTPCCKGLSTTSTTASTPPTIQIQPPSPKRAIRYKRAKSVTFDPIVEIIPFISQYQAAISAISPKRNSVSFPLSPSSCPQLSSSSKLSPTAIDFKPRRAAVAAIFPRRGTWGPFSTPTPSTRPSTIRTTAPLIPASLPPHGGITTPKRTTTLLSPFQPRPSYPSHPPSPSSSPSSSASSSPNTTPPSATAFERAHMVPPTEPRAMWEAREQYLPFRCSRQVKMLYQAGPAPWITEELRMRRRSWFY